MPSPSHPGAATLRTAPGARSTALSKTLVVLAAVLASLTVSLRIQAAIDDRAPLPNGGVDGPCTIWFVGSSTIHKWTTLRDDLRPWIAHNRGRDGALLTEIAQRLDRDRGGTGPAAIVFYGGDNDVAGGLSPTQAVADLRTLIAVKRARYGTTPIIVLGLKPSPTRWDFRARQRSYDMGAERLAAGRVDMRFVDVFARFLVRGQPGPFYVEDGVHLNAAGYAIMTRAVSAALARDLPGSRVRECLASADRD